MIHWYQDVYTLVHTKNAPHFRDICFAMQRDEFYYVEELKKQALEASYTVFIPKCMQSSDKSLTPIMTDVLCTIGKYYSTEILLDVFLDPASTQIFIEKKLRVPTINNMIESNTLP